MMKHLYWYSISFTDILTREAEELAAAGKAALSHRPQLSFEKRTRRAGMLVPAGFCDYRHALKRRTKTNQDCCA